MTDESDRTEVRLTLYMDEENEQRLQDAFSEGEAIETAFFYEGGIEIAEGRLISLPEPGEYFDE